MCALLQPILGFNKPLHCGSYMHCGGKQQSESRSGREWPEAMCSLSGGVEITPVLEGFVSMHAHHGCGGPAECPWA